MERFGRSWAKEEEATRRKITDKFNNGNELRQLYWRVRRGMLF
jgi:hypothetical protein